MSIFYRFRLIHVYVLFLGLLASACSPASPEEHERLDNEVDAALQPLGGAGAFIFPVPGNYAAIPQDPQNPITAEKVALGKQLYHETFMGTQPIRKENMHTYSCASCHHVQAGFQANLPVGLGEGGEGFGSFGEGRRIAVGFPKDSVDKQPIRTPSILGIAWQPNTLWNGQFGATAHNEGTEHLWPAGTPIANNFLGFEGTEIQAIAGIGVHRLGVDSSWVMQYGYEDMFRAAFPGLEAGECFTNKMAGLAIAAYERTVLPDQSPWQRWLNGESQALTVHQKEGAVLFFGKAGCGSCHNGPALTDGDFHVAGMRGLISVLTKDPANLGRGGFTKNKADYYKFKTPQLYNLHDSPFYGHGASYTTLEDLVRFHVSGQVQDARVDPAQLDSALIATAQANLSRREIDAIVDFLENGLYDPNLERYVPEQVVSNHCFPVADPLAKIDLGCE